MNPSRHPLHRRFSALLRLTPSFAAVLLTLLGAAPALAAGKIIRHADTSASLAARWKWAHSEAGKEGYSKGYWIAYCIQRLMSENSYIGSISSDPRRNRPTLGELITGTRQLDIRNPDMYNDDDDLTIGDDNKTARHRVVKEVAILFHFTGDGAGEPGRVKVSNLSLRVELDDEPLFWLGSAPDNESIAFLTTVFSSTHGVDARKELVRAIGLHTPSEEVLNFLRDLLNSNDTPAVREESAFWLGQMNTDAALAVLMHAANSDGSEKVREQSVFGISQMEGDRGLNALIKLAEEDNQRDVQKKAAFWLGQRASEKASATLKDIVYSGKDTEVQKSALFALTQSSDGRAIDDMINIAKTHPNPKIRKEAIFWLGQSENQRAIKALIEIVRQ